VPRNKRKGKGEFFGKQNRDFCAAIVKGGEGPAGSAKLQRQRVVEQMFEAGRVTEACIKPTRGDEAKGSRQRLLQPGARWQEGFLVPGGEVGKGRRDAVEILLDFAGCGSELQDQAGIERILARCAAVNVTRGVGRTARHDRRQFLDQRNGQVASLWHGLPQRGQVQQICPAGCRNGRCGVLGDESRSGFGAGKGRFEIEDGLDGRDIGEQRFDSGRAEQAVQELHG